MSDLLIALTVGAGSASSLLLGAFLARFWRGGSAFIAGLMALGGGALLAAVTIDIIAPAVSAGHLGLLLLGAVVGGGLFEGLNGLLNVRGGFLRKVSTSLGYLRQIQRREREGLLRDLKRTTLLSGIPDREVALVAELFTEVEHEGGDRIYSAGDPCNHIRVVMDGRVDLIHRDGVVEAIDRGGMFGHVSFVMDRVHTTTAVAAGPVRVLRLDRSDLDAKLEQLPKLARRLEHVEEATDAPVANVPPDPPRGIFEGVGADDWHALTSEMFWKEYESGHVFFQRYEATDRLYFVVKGRIRLVHPDRNRKDTKIGPGDALGGLNFVVGQPHRSTAVATEPVGAWVLRKRDYEQLCAQRPTLAAFARGLLGQESSRDGKVAELVIDALATHPQWEVAARLGVEGQAAQLPSESSRARASNHGAPLAIWLGLLLDAIPESLVLGKGVATVATTYALLGGVFISNLPEALSASVGMARRGYSQRRIFVLWAAIVVTTTVGSVLGHLLLADASATTIAFIEGLTAGAMLTMIAETMLPEAANSGGRLTGLWCLAGFLLAVSLGRLGA
ncbi:MAG: cyclic nucleotide-binding domain-containing protein [Myxococcales bacterium FL481]|nr:MAG: cyclic nucleotide-binding domain-containing protein [Myxococcales bacterium FL481]